MQYNLVVLWLACGLCNMPVAHWAYYPQTTQYQPRGAGPKRSRRTAHTWPLHKAINLEGSWLGLIAGVVKAPQKSIIINIRRSWVTAQPLVPFLLLPFFWAVMSYGDSHKVICLPTNTCPLMHVHCWYVNSFRSTNHALSEPRHQYEMALAVVLARLCKETTAVQWCVAVTWAKTPTPRTQPYISAGPYMHCACWWLGSGCVW